MDARSDIQYCDFCAAHFWPCLAFWRVATGCRTCARPGKRSAAVLSSSPSSWSSECHSAWCTCTSPLQGSTRKNNIYQRSSRQIVYWVRSPLWSSHCHLFMANVWGYPRMPNVRLNMTPFYVGTTDTELLVVCFLLETMRPSGRVLMCCVLMCCVWVTFVCNLKLRCMWRNLAHHRG